MPTSCEISISRFPSVGSYKNGESREIVQYDPRVVAGEKMGIEATSVWLAPRFDAKVDDILPGSVVVVDILTVVAPRIILAVVAALNANALMITGSDPKKELS